MISSDSKSCVFCAYTNESELIELASNSLVLEDEIIEFSDMIRNLLFLEIQNEDSAFICENCKNLLIQFHVFKEKAKNNSLLVENANLSKVFRFLEENEGEEIFCTRYNKCLNLVPESKRKFNEIFQHWQPHVVMERAKKRKLDEEPIIETSSVVAEEVKENKVEKTKEDLLEEILETISDIKEVPEQGITENDWAQLEIDRSDLIETKNGISWLCKYCEPGQVVFDSEKNFREHLLSSHLSYEQVAIEEIENEVEEVIVEEYDDVDMAESEIKKEIVLAEILECPHCEFAAGNRVELINHKKINHSRFKKLLCMDCSYQFRTQAHYIAHMNGHQLYEIVAKHKNFPICSICNTMFSDETFESQHYEKHELDEVCDLPMPLTGTFLRYGHHRADVEVKIRESPDNITCGHCVRKFADQMSCKIHQLIFHTSVLKCPVENREFVGNQAFSIHLKNNHPEWFSTDAKFNCSVCKTEFQTLFQKLKHMKTCDQKKYACNHCDKKFSQKCYLTNHLRLVSGQSSVVCDICDKVCRDKGDYQIHARSHSDIKPFQCSLCPKAYKTSSARAAHLETHNEEGYDCEYCPVKFKSRRTLHKHMKTKHAAKVYAKEIDG